MPTYEYKCNACDHRFELFQSMKDGPKRKCPRCGKNALERLIGTGAAVLFKGSGFYQTDYRSDAYKKSAESETKAASPKPDAPAAPKGSAEPAKPPPTGDAPKPTSDTKGHNKAARSARRKSDS